MYGNVLPFDAPDWSSFDSLTVARVGNGEAADFIARNHYAGTGGTQTVNIGLYRGMHLVGVAAFQFPSSPDAAAAVFGPAHSDRVRDLQRFVLVDEAPKNTESWFLARALRKLKQERPQVWAVTSYADASQGHTGVIYQATNAIYGGVSSSETQFLDAQGRLHSNRTAGRRVSVEAGIQRDWTPVRRLGKHRYLFLTPDDRAHRRELVRLVRWESQPYPKTAPTPPAAEKAS